MSTMDTLAPSYRDGARAALARVDREGKLTENNGLILVEAEKELSVGLALLISLEDQIIRGAAFGDPSDDVERALLQVLCEQIEGLPVQEASDHGVIRLEFALRDKTRPRPVAGIVTPRSADPAFRSPEALLRQAVATYRTRSGSCDTANEFDAGPSAHWMAVGDVERRSLLEPVLAEFCHGEGWPADTVRLTAIEYDVRLVVALDVALDPVDKARRLMRLEDSIKEAVDARLEIYLEELEDANVIRQRNDAAAKQALAS